MPRFRCSLGLLSFAAASLVQAAPVAPKAEPASIYPNKNISLRQLQNAEIPEADQIPTPAYPGGTLVQVIDIPAPDGAQFQMNYGIIFPGNVA